MEQSYFGYPTYIICDPRKTEDAAHAKLIEKASAGSLASRVHAPYAGQEVSLALKGSASFQVITRLMMENDRNALQRYVRERSKSYSRAPFMIAVTFERRGNYTLAASWIEKLRAQSRNDHIVLFFAFRIQFRLGNFDLAAQFIDKALLLKPDVPYSRTLAEQISARRKLAAGDVIKRKVIEASGV